MDILSNGLWMGALATVANRSLRVEKKVNIWLAIFWAIFPDIFSFVPVFIWIGAAHLLGSANIPSIASVFTPPPATFRWVIIDRTQLVAHALYNVSHSLIVFGLIFSIVVLVNWLLQEERILHHRLVPWEMLGWLISILVSIFTRAYVVYATAPWWPLNFKTFPSLPWHASYVVVASWLLASMVLIGFYFFNRFKK